MRNVFAPAIFVMIVPVAAQTPPDALMLAKVRSQTADLLSRVPDYACLETIEREAQQPRGGRRRDLVRVEVILAGGNESFAWPGESHTSTDELSRVVGYGLTVTGMFTGFAHNLFTVAGPEIGPGVRESIAGLPMIRYDFSIPADLSDFRLHWGGASAYVGERGSFWVEEETLRLARIEVNADPIPTSLGLRSLRNVIDYSAGAISGTRALIPSSAEAWTRDAQGGSDHDRIFFSQCRQFTSESTLVTEPRAPGQDSESSHPPENTLLPAGLEVPLQLTAAIDLVHATPGDPIQATVTQDAVWKRKSLIPRGSVAGGHVRRVQRVHEPDRVLVALEFDYVQTPGRTYDFFAKLHSMDRQPGLNVVTANSKEGRDSDVADNIPGVCTLSTAGSSPALPAGLHMLWKILDVRSEAPSTREASPRPVPLNGGRRSIDRAAGVPP